ncbi:hypothetical protein KFE80_10110 [bacterium SCSIO 12696]|nr:hypothetical protein KFE80_10110 [bacterium SCSIO 12696]
MQNWPKLRLRPNFQVSLVFLIAFGVAYHFNKSLFISGVFAVLCVFLVIIYNVSQKRKKIRSHLLKVGTTASRKEMYPSDCEYQTVIGLSPLDDFYAALNVTTTKDCIIFGFRKCYRKLSWQEIVAIRHSKAYGQPTVELFINDFQSKNRLFLPWHKNFRQYTPEHLEQTQS